MQHVREPHEYSHIVRTITGRGLRRHKLFYDADIFVDTMKISVSLLSGDVGTSVEELDVPATTHYNTIHLDNNQLYGDNSGIILNAIPKVTPILGMKFPATGSTGMYFISGDYDRIVMYAYQWAVLSGDASIVGGSSKETFLHFTNDGEVVLSCLITNSFGASRRVTTSIQVGSQPKKIMVVRTPITPS